MTVGSGKGSKGLWVTVFHRPSARDDGILFEGHPVKLPRVEGQENVSALGTPMGRAVLCPVFVSLETVTDGGIVRE